MGPVSPSGVTFAGAGHGQGHDVDPAFGEPPAPFADQVTVGGDAHFAAGSRPIVRHLFESRMQERFPPTLETKVVDEVEVWTQLMPQIETEVALPPSVGQDRSWTAGASPGAA